MLRARFGPRAILLSALALLGAVFAGSSTPSLARDTAPLRPDRAPFFSADVAISVDSLGRPALAVSITLPYAELQWLKLEDHYGAGAEITVVFEPLEAGRIYGGAWERRIAVADFAGTRSPNSALIERRTFSIPPGRYHARVGVRDLDSEGSSVARDRIDVPDYSRVPVGFADLELGVVDSSGGFTPVPTRRFGLEVRRLAARAALFDRRAGDWPRGFSFKYRILDEQGQEIMTGVQPVSLSRSAEPVVVRPSNADLFIGSYVFSIEMVEGKSRWRVERSFEVEESGPPLGKDFGRILEPLAYVAEPDEIEYLRHLPPGEQAGGWEEFWRRRDPSPETARNEAMIEFFRRLRYSEQHFQGFGPGWRSDMGRIYIKFGPPDQVETRPLTIQSPLLEVWYYRQPYRRLVFADREGFGRYVLTNTEAE